MSESEIICALEHDVPSDCRMPYIDSDGFPIAKSKSGKKTKLGPKVEREAGYLYYIKGRNVCRTPMKRRKKNCE